MNKQSKFLISIAIYCFVFIKPAVVGAQTLDEELKKCSTPKNIIVSVIHNKIKLKNHLLSGDVLYIPGKETADEWIVYPWDVF